jgi:hypothetical protein
VSGGRADDVDAVPLERSDHRCRLRWLGVIRPAPVDGHAELLEELLEGGGLMDRRRARP